MATKRKWHYYNTKMPEPTVKSKALKKKNKSNDNYLFESVDKTIKRIKDNPFDSRYD